MEIQIVFLLIGSIVFPQFLAGLRISTQCPSIIFGSKSKEEPIKYGVLTFCLTPILRLLISLKLHIFHLMERLNLANENLYKKKSELKYHLRNMEKLELGLETIYQLSLQLVLLLNAVSETRTNHGLNVVFGTEENTSSFKLALLALSIMWSCVSCSLSHLKGLMVHRDHFPALSKLVAGLFALISILKRVLCIILYFTPAMGLFSLLRHLQAEQTAFTDNMLHFANDNNGTIQFSNISILWETIDRWNRKTNEPPNYTLYTGLSLQYYFFIFMSITMSQLFTIFGVKRQWSDSFSRSNILNKIIHCLGKKHIF